MKYSDCLLDNFEDVVRHVQDGLDFCKDFVNFTKKREQIEEEYSRDLQKLCKTTLENRKKSSVTNGRLYESFSMMISEVEHAGVLHKQFATQIDKLVVEAMQNFIKEMEQTKKVLTSEGNKFKEELKDAYTSLKKAQDNRDKLVKEAEEAEENANRIASNPNKAKEQPKATAKAQTNREKAKASEIQVDQCTLIAEEKQELYYKKWMPSLMDRFQSLEVSRISFLKDVMNTAALMESRLPPKIKSGCDRLQNILEEVDVDEEINHFIKEHMKDTYSTASVSSLQGAMKKGRLLKMESNNIWKSRFLVLMSQQQRLYIFESEDSNRPSDIINLKNCFIRPVHDSLFAKKFCFQIIFFNESKIYCAPNDYELREWVRMMKACSLSVEMQDYLASARRISYLSLHVIEAKQLPVVDPIRRSSNPYAVISLDKMKQGQTQTILSSTHPLWNERIFLDDVPHFETCTIKIFSESLFPMKDIELASIEIPLNVIQSNLDQDHWFPLMASNAVNSPSGLLLLAEVDDEAITNMSIRIKMEFKSELVLPLMEYKDFVKTFLNEDLVAVKLLAETHEDRDLVVQLTVKIWHSIHSALNHLRKVIISEIESTTSTSILFRSNSFAAKTTEQYMKIVASDYIQNILIHPTKAVLNSKSSCEIDDTRVTGGEDIQKNARRLLSFVKMYLESIYNSTEQMPNELRCLFHIIQDKVSQQFKDDPKIRYTSVSGFLFLRLICPAIVSPKQYELCQDHLDDRSTRTLKLIAKIIQTIANLVDDFNKENYMSEINDFIRDNFENVKKFINDVSTIPPSVSTSKRSAVDIARELESIRNCFKEAREKMSLNPSFKHPSVESIYQEVDKITEVTKKYEEVGKETKDDSSPVKKSPSGFSIIGLY